MEYACEWMKNNIDSVTPSQPYPCEWVKAHWDDEIKQAPYPCVALEKYFGEQNLKVTVSPASKSAYWGTNVSDMQSGLTVSGNAITGTLKYLDEGELVDAWGAGNFMALKFTVPEGATSCKVGMVPSASGMQLQELDEDKDGVWKVTDKDVQKFVVETTDGSYTLRQEFNLSGLICNAE